MARDRKTNKVISHTVAGLVLPPAARDAGALHQHISSFDVLQTADVAASRRSGSRTRERGRDLRPGGAVTLWVVTEPEFRRETAMWPHQESPGMAFTSGSFSLMRRGRYVKRGNL